MLCRVVQLPWASRQWPSLQRLQQGKRHAPDAALLIRSRSLGPRSGLLAGAMHGEQEMGHVELPVQRGLRHRQPVLEKAVDSTIRTERNRRVARGRRDELDGLGAARKLRIPVPVH